MQKLNVPDGGGGSFQYLPSRAFSVAQDKNKNWIARSCANVYLYPSCFKSMKGGEGSVVGKIFILFIWEIQQLHIVSP